MMNIIFTLVKNLDWILSYFRGDNQKRKIGYPFGYLLYIYIYNKSICFIMLYPPRGVTTTLPEWCFGRGFGWFMESPPNIIVARNSNWFFWDSRQVTSCLKEKY
jgi:hypothetical protein